MNPYPCTTFPTSWAGHLTFQQIYDDLAYYASNVMKRNGFRPHEIPECLQNGFMVLWETLSARRDFLTGKTRRQAVFFILARSKISSMRYQEGMYDSLDALISEDWHNTVDEQLIDGMQYQRGERWAGWATEIDMRIDIERIMVKLATKYESSFQHLVALYFITTQVKRVDAAKLVGADPFRWYRNYVVPLLVEVQFEFAQVFLEEHHYQPAGETVLRGKNRGRFTSPYREWRAAYQHGNTAPADALLTQYAHTPCLVLALQAQIDGKTYHEAALHYGRKFNTFKKHMKRAARLLKTAYA